MFDDYIIHDRTDRCNIMCPITAHDKQQPTYVYDSGSGCNITIPKNTTTTAL